MASYPVPCPAAWDGCCTAATHYYYTTPTPHPYLSLRGPPRPWPSCSCNSDSGCDSNKCVVDPCQELDSCSAQACLDHHATCSLYSAQAQELSKPGRETLKLHSCTTSTVRCTHSSLHPVTFCGMRADARSTPFLFPRLRSTFFPSTYPVFLVDHCPCAAHPPSSPPPFISPFLHLYQQFDRLIDLTCAFAPSFPSFTSRLACLAHLRSAAALAFTTSAAPDHRIIHPLSLCSSNPRPCLNQFSRSHFQSWRPSQKW